MQLTQLLFAAIFAATIPVPDRPADHQFRATAYQPHQTVKNCGRSNRPWIDSTGGGPNGAWTGKRLEPWHCAVASRRTKALPYGTIIKVGSPINREMLVVDCGPGVRSNQLDFCFIYEKDYDKFIHDQGELRRRWVNVWVTGKIGRKAARTWRPTSERGE